MLFMGLTSFFEQVGFLVLKKFLQPDVNYTTIDERK